jgi:hypothetical protein
MATSFVPRSAGAPLFHGHGAGLEARTQILTRAAALRGGRIGRTPPLPVGRSPASPNGAPRSTASSVGLPPAPPGVANPITRHDVT